MLCDNFISRDIAQSCENPLYAGIEGIAYIFNKADVATFTRSGNVISALALASGKKAYKIQVSAKQPFNGTKIEMVEGAISNKWNKTFSMGVASDSADDRENIDDILANGSFVIVFEHSYTPTGPSGDIAGKFEMFGFDKGLKASSIVRDFYSEDTDGGAQVELVEESVPNAGMFVFGNPTTGSATNATTRALLESLCE